VHVGDDPEQNVGAAAGRQVPVAAAADLVGAEHVLPPVRADHIHEEPVLVVNREHVIEVDGVANRTAKGLEEAIVREVAQMRVAHLGAQGRNGARRGAPGRGQVLPGGRDESVRHPSALLPLFGAVPG
jgi:hypothetical protein